MARKNMQNLCLRMIDWYYPLPDDFLIQWNIYYIDIPKLEEIWIRRWSRQTRSSLSCKLHRFSDAFAWAYFAVAYHRFLHKSSEMHVYLLFAKTKVAPILPLSIPRLKLFYITFCLAQQVLKTSLLTALQGVSCPKKYLIVHSGGEDHHGYRVTLWLDLIVVLIC